MRRLRVLHIVKKPTDPRLKMVVKKRLLCFQWYLVAVANDERHGIAQCGNMILGLGNSRLSLNAKSVQVTAQYCDRLFHQESGHVQGAERHQLTASNADKQRKIFVMNGCQIGFQGSLPHQLPPHGDATIAGVDFADITQLLQGGLFRLTRQQPGQQLIDRSAHRLRLILQEFFFALDAKRWLINCHDIHSG